MTPLSSQLDGRKGRVGRQAWNLDQHHSSDLTCGTAGRCAIDRLVTGPSLRDRFLVYAPMYAVHGVSR